MWAVFGSREEKLPADWDAVTARAIFGSVELDASATTPGPERAVRAFCLFGAVKLVVPEGARVHAAGASVLGSREVSVTPGDGPEVRLNATAIMGSVEVKPSG
jgi:predicted membrane protein